MKFFINLFLIVACHFSLPVFSQNTPPPPPPPEQEIVVSSDDKVFSRVEIEARFPGGDKKWIDYLVKTINTEVPQNKFAPPGNYTVVVQFIVDKDGNISEVKGMTSHGFGMEEEVIRVIKNGPKWEPAIQGGRKVKAYRKQPVTFQVEREFELSTYTLKAGEENTVELTLGSIKDADITVTVSNGTVKPLGDKSYLLKPSKPGNLLFSVTAKVKKKLVDFGKIMLQVK